MTQLALERDRTHYYRAIELAKFSDYPVRVGSVAAVNSKFLAGAFNTVRNLAENVGYGSATYHAEYNCICLVPPRLLSRITLYVARVNKAGQRMPSRPCDRCWEMISANSVRKVVYFDGEFIVKERV